MALYAPFFVPSSKATEKQSGAGSFRFSGLGY